MSFQRNTIQDSPYTPSCPLSATLVILENGRRLWCGNGIISVYYILRISMRLVRILYIWHFGISNE